MRASNAKLRDIMDEAVRLGYLAYNKEKTGADPAALKASIAALHAEAAPIYKELVQGGKLIERYYRYTPFARIREQWDHEIADANLAILPKYYMREYGVFEDGQLVKSGLGSMAEAQRACKLPDVTPYAIAEEICPACHSVIGQCDAEFCSTEKGKI